MKKNVDLKNSNLAGRDLRDYQLHLHFLDEEIEAWTGIGCGDLGWLSVLDRNLIASPDKGKFIP